MADVEKQPPKWRWNKEPIGLPNHRGLISASRWTRGRCRVITALEMAESPNGSGQVIPQWHVSVSIAPANGVGHGHRATDEDVGRVLQDFDMVGAEEDNHHPGVARHFWLPVDSAHRVDCECKAGEAVVTETDGYQWSNKAGKCRGCDYQRLLGIPCSVHAPDAPKPPPMAVRQKAANVVEQLKSR